MYKVIIIEDDELIRDHLVSFVNNYAEDFVVVSSFSDGREGIEFLATNKIDLIITDIKMADISGLEVAQYIYDHQINTKVIIISGYQDFSYAQTAIKYNVFCYLTKPTDPIELQETLMNLKEKLDNEYSSNSPATKSNKLSTTPNVTIDEQSMIERVMLYIDSNLNSDITIGKISKKFYLSEDYFGKVFKKVTGKNFSHYLISKRMDNAIKLLESGQYTVSEITKLSGYSSTNYFIKAFRKYTGYTPKKYPRTRELNHED